MGKVADLSVYTPGGQPGAPNPSEGLAVLRQNQTAFMETIGVMPPESLTIADGAISPTTAVCIVDTEGGAPADDLATINATLSDGSTLHDGMVILLSSKDASRIVTVKNSDAPNGIKTTGGVDITLSTAWAMILQYASGVWQQISLLGPATATTIGGVRPKDGDGGLTVDEQGNLSVMHATKTQRGSVLASITPVANTVPQAGGDGKISEDWFDGVLKTDGDQIVGEAKDTQFCIRKTADNGSLALSGGAEFDSTDGSIVLHGKNESSSGLAGIIEMFVNGAKFSVKKDGIYPPDNGRVLSTKDIFVQAVSPSGPVYKVPDGGTWSLTRLQWDTEGKIVEVMTQNVAGGSDANISNTNAQFLIAYRVSV